MLNQHCRIYINTYISSTELPPSHGGMVWVRIVKEIFPPWWWVSSGTPASGEGSDQQRFINQDRGLALWSSERPRDQFDLQKHVWTVNVHLQWNLLIFYVRKFKDGVQFLCLNIYLCVLYIYIERERKKEWESLCKIHSISFF